MQDNRRSASEPEAGIRASELSSSPVESNSCCEPSPSLASDRLKDSRCSQSRATQGNVLRSPFASFFQKVFRTDRRPNECNRRGSTTTSRNISENNRNTFSKFPSVKGKYKELDGCSIGSPTVEESVAPPPLVRTNAYREGDTNEFPIRETPSKKVYKENEFNNYEETSKVKNEACDHFGSLNRTLTPSLSSTPLTQSFAYIWGDNSKGQILTSEPNCVLIPHRVEKVARHSMVHVECGSMSTWLVSDTGDLWAGGCNDMGQISPSTADDSPDINYPLHLEEFEAMRVRSVSSGGEHSVILLLSGAAMSYGSNEFGQLGHGLGTESLGRAPLRKLGTPNLIINQVACGSYHTLVLSATGQVFSCGNGADGCLGLGVDHFDSSSVLMPIPALFAIPIQQIVAGPEHSMALSLSGKIFSWGRNKLARLGFASPSSHNSIIGKPQLVDTPNLPLFKYIATGPSHSIAIASKGLLYFSGDNSEGQLGHDPTEIPHLLVFSVSTLTFHNKIRLAACGDKHTVVVTLLGELFTFGRNNEGQLGVGNKIDFSWKPVLVNFNTEQLYVYAVSAGRDHTAALAVHLPSSLCDKRHRIDKKKGDDSSLITEQISSSTISKVKDNGYSYDSQSVESNPMLSRIHSLKTSYPDQTDRFPIILQNSTKRHTSFLKSLPSFISRVSEDRNPALSIIQSLCSLTSFDTPTIISENPSTADLTRLISTANTHSLKQKDIYSHIKDTWNTLPLNETILPAGCSTYELLSRIQSLTHSQYPDDQLRQLKRRISSVYSDTHRLNCSFLLPGRLALFDAEGLEDVTKNIEQLDPMMKQSIDSEMYQAVWKCLDAVEPYAKEARQTDQIRYIPIILQSGFLMNPSASNIRLMSRLVSIIFQFPPEGRRALVNVFRYHYPADVFGKRVLHHVKLFLNTVISAQGGHYQTEHSIWHGVLLLQLLYLASVEWASDERHRAIEITCRERLDGKVPLEEFCLESIGDSVDPAIELRLYHLYSLVIPSSCNKVLQTHTDSGTNETNVNMNYQNLNSLQSLYHDNQRIDAPPTIMSQLGDMNDRSSVQLPCEPSSTTPHMPYHTPPPQPNILDAYMKEPCVPEHQNIIIEEKQGPLFDCNNAITITELHESWNFFLIHRNLCPLRFKRNAIILEAMTVQRHIGVRSLLNQGHPFFFMPVRRSHLVEDALNIILCSPGQSLLKPLKVIFDGEEGIDEGGLKREFFSILVETLFDPNFGMFIYNEHTRTVWFNKNTIDSHREFFLIGVVLGLALYNDILLSVKFPHVVFRKLQDERVDIDDLADIFPDEGNSFNQMARWPEEQREEFNQTFEDMCFEVQYDYFGELRTVELKLNGSHESLTYHTRHEYIQLYIDYLLNTSIQTQFQAFKQGFIHFQTLLVKSLSGRELQLLICGSPTLDFYDLQKGAQYEGYHQDEIYMKDFWDILFEFTTHQKKKFLQFCTGTDRVPLGGLKELKLKIQKNGVEPTERLPTAYTCFNSLLLPVYNSKDKLKRLLIIAIEQSQGFGLQ